MTGDEPRLTAADFAVLPWAEALADCPHEELGRFCELFTAEAQRRGMAGDERGARAYRFLVAIGALRATFDRPGRNWEAQFKELLGPDDLDEEDLNLLEALLPQVRKADYRARICDVLWCLRKKKNPEYARDAIRAYLESAEKLRTDKPSPHRTFRVRRALQLSALLGKDKEEYRSVIATVEAAAAEAQQAAQPWLGADFQQMLLDQRVGDPSQYASLCAAEAARLEQQGNFIWAHRYWKLRVQWVVKLRDPNAYEEARLRAGECQVNDAKATSARSSGAAKTKLAQAIETLRQAGAPEARITELRRLHEEYALKSLDEMGTITLPREPFQSATDAIVQTAIAGVKGKSFADALVWLAGYYRPTNAAAMRETIIKQAQSNPLLMLLGRDFIGARGRTIARSEGGLDVTEQLILSRMFEMAGQVEWHFRMVAVRTAVEEIMAEHNPQMSDLAFLIAPNPLIEPGREMLFAEGLMTGLRDDWVVSAHLLAPQVEHMLRYMLQMVDADLTTLNADGVEEIFGLDRLLRSTPKLEELIGPDLTFDLRGILVERAGLNLRNNLAHGLMPADAFYGAGPVNLWWLVLHMLSQPFFSIAREAAAPTSEGPPLAGPPLEK